jgi:hypothetical protein
MTYLGARLNNLPIVLSLYPIIISFSFPYRFDDSNTEKLQTATSESGVDAHLFGFDPKSIHWEDYLLNTHIPGLIKYALKL